MKVKFRGCISTRTLWLKKDKVTLCGVLSSCNVQKSKVTVLRSSNLSSEIPEYRPLSSSHALPADRRNKTLESKPLERSRSLLTSVHPLILSDARVLGLR